MSERSAARFSSVAARSAASPSLSAALSVAHSARSFGISALTAAFSRATRAHTPRTRSTSLNSGVCVQPSTECTEHTGHTPPLPLTAASSSTRLTLQMQHTGRIALRLV